MFHSIPLGTSHPHTPSMSLHYKQNFNFKGWGGPLFNTVSLLFSTATIHFSSITNQVSCTVWPVDVNWYQSPTHTFNVSWPQTIASPSLAVQFSTTTALFSTTSDHFSTIAMTEPPAQWHTTVNGYSFSECSTSTRIGSRQGKWLSIHFRSTGSISVYASQ